MKSWELKWRDITPAFMKAKVHHLHKCKQELAQRHERYQDRVHQLDQHIDEVGKKNQKNMLLQKSSSWRTKIMIWLTKFRDQSLDVMI